MIIAEPVLQDKKAAPSDSKLPKKILMDTYAAEMSIRKDWTGMRFPRPREDNRLPDILNSGEVVNKQGKSERLT